VLCLALGWLLLGAYAVVLVAGAAVGERESSYADLQDAVRSHHVDSVQVDRAVSPDGRRVRGAEQVAVHWRRGLVRHVAEVQEGRRARAGGIGYGDRAWSVDSVRGDLQALDAGVEVTYVDDPHGHTVPATLKGWRLPDWVRACAALALLGTFLLLLTAPTPWRANRWAWFWGFVLVAPVGQMAFLVLGGPTGLLPPRHPERRVRGGRGFLLALAVGIAGSVALTSVGLAG
jgi:hypothetical protein